MRLFPPLALMLWASTAMAHHEQSPLREAMIDGHQHDVGGATWWLAGTAIAIGIALYAVHKSVFRKR